MFRIIENAIIRAVRDMAVIERQRNRRHYRQGPGERTIFTLHKGIGTSKYEPHASTRERTRAARQLRRRLAREDAPCPS